MGVAHARTRRDPGERPEPEVERLRRTEGLDREDPLLHPSHDFAVVLSGVTRSLEVLGELDLSALQIGDLRGEVLHRRREGELRARGGRPTYLASPSKPSLRLGDCVDCFIPAAFRFAQAPDRLANLPDRRFNLPHEISGGRHLFVCWDLGGRAHLGLGLQILEALLRGRPLLIGRCVQGLQDGRTVRLPAGGHARQTAD